MRWFSWLRRDRVALEQAKQADAEAGQRLREVRARAPEARATARWAERTLTENHLTERFIRDLRHGGHA